MALILAALLGVFISLVGVWFITSPFNAVQAFGIDPSHMADIALAPGFGVRDVALGLIIIGFALARKPGAAGTALTCDTVLYNDPPYRFEAGTPPIAEAAALTAALDYMDSIGKDRIRAHETDLRHCAEELLKPIKSLRFIGHAPEKGAIISFAMEGAHAHDVATILDRSGIAVRAGTHCAEPLLARFGLTSTCRASFGLYNTRAEVEALAEGLQKAERFFR